MTDVTLGVSARRLSRLDAVLHRYVDEGRLPGVQTAITRHGELVHRDCYGWIDVAQAVPVTPDALYRIYSMTKPVVSVALMMLYEEGRLLLEDPVARWIPEFAEMEVWVGGSADEPRTRPTATPLRVHHLLTHTSGLTYGFHFAHPLDELYRRHGLGDFSTPTFDLEACMRRLAAQPLLFEPGTRWNYSMATDVCGALIERICDVPLDHALRSRVLEPLGMEDTGFCAPPAAAGRCSVLYAHTPGSSMTPIAPGSAMTTSPILLSGGGGLVGSTDDYLRFCHMVRNGGALEGVRLLSPRTVAFMTANHLPGGRTLNEMGQGTFAEVAMEGTGFGLGFSVLVDPPASTALGSAGLFGWGGAASTAFWVDPHEDLVVVFMTQLLPSSTYPLRRHLQAGVYQALVD